MFQNAGTGSLVFVWMMVMMGVVVGIDIGFAAETPGEATVEWNPDTNEFTAGNTTTAINVSAAATQHADAANGRPSLTPNGGEAGQDADDAPTVESEPLIPRRWLSDDGKRWMAVYDTHYTRFTDTSDYYLSHTAPRVLGDGYTHAMNRMLSEMIALIAWGAGIGAKITYANQSWLEPWFARAVAYSITFGVPAAVWRLRS